MLRRWFILISTSSWYCVQMCLRLYTLSILNLLYSGDILAFYTLHEYSSGRDNYVLSCHWPQEISYSTTTTPPQLPHPAIFLWDPFPPLIWLNTWVTNHYMTDDVPLAPTQTLGWSHNYVFVVPGWKPKGSIKSPPSVRSFVRPGWSQKPRLRKSWFFSWSRG